MKRVSVGGTTCGERRATGVANTALSRVAADADSIRRSCCCVAPGKSPGRFLAVCLTHQRPQSQAGMLNERVHVPRGKAIKTSFILAILQVVGAGSYGPRCGLGRRSRRRTEADL